MNRQEKSGVSSVGRAASPEPQHKVVPVQDESEGWNGTEVAGENLQVHLPDQETKAGQYTPDDGEGNGETLRVGGSSPSHLTNLPATFTPDWLADDMVSLARIYPGMRVLEPSAGRGSIVRSIHRLTAGRVTAIELNGDMIADLRDTNAVVLKQDFLRNDMIMEGYFARVVMNPPGSLLSHVEKAMECLERRGRLVALLHQDRAMVLSDYYPDVRRYDLPLNTFQIKQKLISASIIVWDKP